MIWPQLTVVAFTPVSVPHTLCFSPRNYLLLFERATLVPTSAPLHMLFPLLRMPSSLLHLVNPSHYDPSQLLPRLLTPL